MAKLTVEEKMRKMFDLLSDLVELQIPEVNDKILKVMEEFNRGENER